MSYVVRQPIMKGLIASCQCANVGSTSHTQAIALCTRNDRMRGLRQGNGEGQGNGEVPLHWMERYLSIGMERYLSIPLLASRTPS